MDTISWKNYDEKRDEIDRDFQALKIKCIELAKMGENLRGDSRLEYILCLLVQDSQMYLQNKYNHGLLRIFMNGVITKIDEYVESLFKKN